MVDISLKGRLRGGIVERGGEHTGFNLEDVIIEIDMSEIANAQDLDGKEIVAEGNIELMQYLERGDVWIFKAISAKKL